MCVIIHVFIIKDNMLLAHETGMDVLMDRCVIMRRRVQTRVFTGYGYHSCTLGNVRKPFLVLFSLLRPVCAFCSTVSQWRPPPLLVPGCLFLTVSPPPFCLNVSRWRLPLSPVRGCPFVTVVAPSFCRRPPPSGDPDGSFS